ncbi:MAG: hypothetical protein R3Y21_04030 [Mycoplasmatota bacterium]
MAKNSKKNNTDGIWVIVLLFIGLCWVIILIYKIIKFCINFIIKKYNEKNNKNNNYQKTSNTKNNKQTKINKQLKNQMDLFKLTKEEKKQVKKGNYKVYDFDDATIDEDDYYYDFEE